MRKNPAGHSPKSPPRKRNPSLRRDESLFCLYYYLFLRKPYLPDGATRNPPGAPSRNLQRQWLSHGVFLLCGLGGICLYLSKVRIFGNEDARAQRTAAASTPIPRPGPEPRELAWRFLRAASALEKAQQTRFPEKDLGRIRAYHADADTLDRKVIAFREIGLIRGDDTSFWAFAAVLEGGHPHLVAVVEDPRGALAVDWDCFVCANDPAWDELETPAHAGKEYPFRVLAERSDYYNNRFADESDWACYSLSAPGQSHHVHGYCRRDSPAHLALEAALPEVPEPERVMIGLRGEPDSLRTNQFEITAFVRREWVVP